MVIHSPTAINAERGTRSAIRAISDIGFNSFFAKELDQEARLALTRFRASIVIVANH